MAEFLLTVAVTVTVSLAVWVPIALSLYREHRQFVLNTESEFYVLRQPRFVFGLGLVVTLLFSLAFFASAIVSGEWIGVLFLPFCVLGMILAIYAVRWKIVVMGNRMELYRPCKAPVEIDMRRLERVAQEHGGIIAYLDGKKLFGVESWVAGYDILYNRLLELGKMESTLNRRSFRVRRSKAEPVAGGFCTIAMLAFLVWMHIAPNNTATPLVKAIFMGFALMALGYTAASLRWKLAVKEDVLLYRTLLRGETSVSFGDIEQVILKNTGLQLVFCGKAGLKVESVYKEYATLVKRLKEEKVPFYDKGKLIEVGE